MVIVYVDDTIIAGPDVEPIDALITNLGVSAANKDTETFMLRGKGEVGDFQGIHIEKVTQNSFNLTQTCLINKDITTAGMNYCNTVITLATTAPLGSHKLGLPFNETWEYTS